MRACRMGGQRCCGGCPRGMCGQLFRGRLAGRPDSALPASLGQNRALHRRRRAWTTGVMTSHSSRLLALDRQGKARKRKRRPRRKSLMLGTKTSVLVTTSRLLNQPGVAEVDASPDRTSRDPPRESLAAGGKQQRGGSAADRSLRYSGHRAPRRLLQPEMTSIDRDGL
jgi:hypothetical protein